MGLSYQSGNYASEFNSVYKITLDMSGWDRTTVQVVAPTAGTIFVYGSNDDGNSPAMRDGNAKLATNFTLIQAKPLATGTAANSFSGAGNYEIDINAQFLRLQGVPAAAGTYVYAMIFNHSKVG